MKIGPYEVGKIDAKVLCARKIGQEDSMTNEPKPCRCGKDPSVFKIFGEWEVSCDDECKEVHADTKIHAIQIWNERTADRPSVKESGEK